MTLQAGLAHLALLVVFAMTANVDALAQRRSDDGRTWIKVGTHKVDREIEKDVFDLKGIKGSIRALRLTGFGSTINIAKTVVTFADGTRLADNRSVTLNPRGAAHTIEVGDEERFVDDVSVVYAARGRQRRSATVTLTALQTRSGAAALRPAAAASDKTQSEMISARRPDIVLDGNALEKANELLTLKVGRHIAKFSRVRLRVAEQGVFVTSMQVFYTDGSITTVPVAAVITAGSRSDWLPIDGSKFIEKVVLTCRASTERTRPRIELLGDVSDNWVGAAGEAGKHNQGWRLLGAETAGFLGFDNDHIAAAPNAGRFDRLRITVRKRAVTMKDLTVVFADGSRETFDIRQRLNAGATFGPIELGENNFAIRGFQARYRSRFIDNNAKGGRAIVEIWGKPH